MTRRIYGLETELGLTCLRRGSGARAMGADEAARLLFRPLVEETGASSTFLLNGARLYLDVGSHPEYATPECDDLLQLLAHDRAGEQVLADLARAGDEALAAEGVDAQLVLLKNNVDSHGNSYGCHENYLVGRVGSYATFADALLGFLTTRQLLCGAGRLVRTPQGTRFSLSQRADHMLDAVSAATTRSRPMINTRDEPHGDPRLHRRLHVIVGDSNLSDVTTLLKVGSTELVLRALEREPGVFDDLRVADPVGTIQASATDVRGRAPVVLLDGRRTTALQLQGAYLERCERLDDLSPVLQQVLVLWAKVLDRLDTDRLDDLATEIDWVVKHRWLDRYAARHDLRLGSAELAQLDLAFHRVTGGGVFRMLEARGAVARITTPEQVRAAVEHPPATTRASLRGRFVAAGREHGRRVDVDWTTFVVSDLENARATVLDPFATHDDAVDDLIARMGREPRADLPCRFADPMPI